jgi:PAS domain-containing protein
MGAERRINAVWVEQEKQFYLATTAALEGSRRSQLGLSALVGLVLALGVAGVTLVTSRSRSRIATAYDALKGEVGERRAAEDALRASEGRFRSLVQRASDLTVVTDATGIVHYVSPAAETLLGHRPEDLLDLPLLVHVEPDQRAGVGQAIAFLAEQPGLVHTIELRLCTPTVASAPWKRSARTCWPTPTWPGWSGTGATSPTAGRWRSSSPTRPATTR